VQKFRLSPYWAFQWIAGFCSYKSSQVHCKVHHHPETMAQFIYTVTKFMALILQFIFKIACYLHLLVTAILLVKSFENKQSFIIVVITLKNVNHRIVRQLWIHKLCIKNHLKSVFFRKSRSFTEMWFQNSFDSFWANEYLVNGIDELCLCTQLMKAGSTLTLREDTLISGLKKTIGHFITVQMGRQVF